MARILLIKLFLTKIKCISVLFKNSHELTDFDLICIYTLLYRFVFTSFFAVKKAKFGTSLLPAFTIHTLVIHLFVKYKTYGKYKVEKKLPV